MKAKTRIRGWLTREDIEMLEEASKRKLKYPKNPAKKYVCGACEYSWFYYSVRCPVCSSPETNQVAK